MVQAFPEGGYGWHLGRTGSGYMNKHSVGLEICSIGYLDDEYRSYVNQKAKSDQVINLTNFFRNKRFWHRYSDKQIEEVEKLIKYIGDRDQIDMRVGLQQWIKEQGPIKAFGFQEDTYLDLNLLAELATNNNVELSKFCRLITSKEIFKSEQSARNAINKVEKKKLLIKDGSNKKFIYINKDMNIQSKGIVLLDIKVLGSETKEA